ncbi:MAG TPA: LysR family transcriptional regulator [Steroidobacteraceae bacterium]|nr:LysR family transcriptional regulator [Steroidobacteraceae bacterium]
MPELSQLACFVAAAEELHFGHAASRLHMTQPSLSRQVQALERTLKVQLFERGNRTIKLTSAGRVFLPEAKRILALTESAANWTRRTWQGQAGVIRLGFTATAAFVDLPLILSRATAALPDVKILLKEGTSAMQKDALLADMLDVAVLRPPIDRSRFKAMPVRKERFVAALHSSDPRAGQPQLALRDFDGRNFIMYSVDGAGYSHRMLSAMFDQAGVAPIMVHQLDQNHSILALVSAGMGAALVPHSLTLISFPNIVFREIALQQCDPIEMYILWRPENANPVLATFLALCRSIYAEGSATSHAMRASINNENTLDDAP